MTCDKGCKDQRNFIRQLEKALAEGGSPCVPESFERRARDYCDNCLFNGKVGEGYRKAYGIPA